MPINANWQAGFLLELVGPVKVTSLQRPIANLANRVIGGVGSFDFRMVGVIFY